MLVIKSLSSHADLVRGVPKYTMTVGPDDVQGGVEVELDAESYVSLVELSNQFLSRSPTPYTPGREEVDDPRNHEDMKKQVEEENILADELRRLEGAERSSTNGLTPQEMLRSVGWFGDEEGEQDSETESDLLSLVPDEDDEEDLGEMRQEGEEEDGVRQF